jgi:predicted HicB family RNase H-like nuclease
MYNIKKFELGRAQTVKIDKQLKELADNIAEENKWSFNTLMNIALQVYLNKRIYDASNE